MAMIRMWIKQLRIKHWIKNFFVLAPFLVGPRFGINEFFLQAIEGTILFCVMSSAVYLLNDVVDARSDMMHREKRLRPIASGKISPVVAGVICAGMALLSLGAAVALNFQFFLILCLYGINNVLYSLYLKRKTVLDVMSIALGFVMRIYAGGFLVDLQVTQWLIVCVFSLSLMMGFGKRRSEYEDLGEASKLTRKVNESYSIPKLNVLLASSGSIAIMAYMLYAVSPETKSIHGTDKIIFTTPFVVYCIYRFLLKVQEGDRGEPVELITRDRGFVLAGFLWLLSILFLVHRGNA
jgi:4-hydroxybenzoate polyprenyltransferase